MIFPFLMTRSVATLPPKQPVSLPNVSKLFVVQGPVNSICHEADPPIAQWTWNLSILRNDLPLQPRELIGNFSLVDLCCNFRVSGLSDHGRKSALELIQGPADRIVDAFVFHLASRAFTARSAHVIMRVFVKAVEAENSFAFTSRIGGRDVERQAFVAAAEAFSMRDGHAHAALLDNNRNSLGIFHRSILPASHFG